MQSANATLVLSHPPFSTYLDVDAIQPQMTSLRFDDVITMGNNLTNAENNHEQVEVEYGRYVSPEISELVN